MSREAETIFNGTIKDTLAKSEALQKNVKTVTMRAEALATTEAGLLQGAPRSPRRGTETPERALSAGEPAKHFHSFHAMKTAQRRRKKQAHAWITNLLCFPTSCQSPKRWGLMFARRPWERNDLAPSMSSVPKALSRAAHLMQ